MGSRDQRRHDRAQLAATLAARRIDRDDHELLTYAIKWLPYGGGPDGDILVNFGLSKQVYLDRLRDVVDRQLDHIHPPTAARLIQFCDDAAVDTASLSNGRQKPTHDGRVGAAPDGSSFRSSYPSIVTGRVSATGVP